MQNLTVGDAIRRVLSASNSPLTAKEILAEILEKKHYHFNSTNPLNIVMNELRRHCKGNMQSENRSIQYEKLQNGSYKLLMDEKKV